MKRFSFAVASYLFLTLALAYPWHLIWFHDFYLQAGAMTRAVPIVPLGMLAMLAQGVVIAYLYPRFYRGGNPIEQGIHFSLLMGIVVYSVMGPATAAKLDINPVGGFLLYAGIFQAMQSVVTGAALGLIYGRLPIRGSSQQRA